jgi:hypothetical protein
MAFQRLDALFNAEATVAEIIDDGPIKGAVDMSKWKKGSALLATRPKCRVIDLSQTRFYSNHRLSLGAWHTSILLAY